MKSLLFLIMICTFATDAYSQNFQYVKFGSDTAVYTGAEPDAEYSWAYIKNTGSAPLNLRFERTFENVPLNWTSSLCYELCYAPFISVIPPPPDPPITLAPGDQDTMDIVWYVPSNGFGTVRVKLYNTDNTAQFIERTFYVRRGTVGITPVNSVVKNFELKQNYPNPFNPTTNINFSIPKNQNVSLKVYDLMGKEVASLVNQFMHAGEYKADFSGASLSSGVYYYALKTDEFSSTKSMLLIK